MRCEADHKDGGVCLTPLTRNQFYHGQCPRSYDHQVSVPQARRPLIPMKAA